ncbi:MAG: riboflavin biosynthesis protein RibF [Oscillospiraceae bacterium]|nr:riboflavin biosynthesis protein RibF [Oscillospiraceae bacterium]
MSIVNCQLTSVVLIISDNIGSAVALGLFDGLHLGHRAVLARAIECSVKYRLVPAVMTFIVNGSAPDSKGKMEQIMSDNLKSQMIREFGIKKLLTPHFDQIRNMSPEDFAGEYIMGRLGAGAIVCGADFRFGRNAAGDADTLRRLCGGVAIDIVEPVLQDGDVISSTRIRRLIAAGNIENANRLLGYDYTFDGLVIRGNGVGRRLGLPTINQRFPSGNLIPKYGVYASQVNISGKIYAGITNIGVKPTVTRDGDPLAETYIIDQNMDLYNTNPRISLQRFIREERRFNSVDELRAAIAKDIVVSRQIISNHYFH